MGDIGQVGVSMALNIEGTGGEDEARRPATNHATPLPTVFADNPHEANDAGTYDTTYPAVSHEQFIRTNTIASSITYSQFWMPIRGGAVYHPPQWQEQVTQTVQPLPGISVLPPL